MIYENVPSRIENDCFIIPLVDYVEDVNYSMFMLFDDFIDLLQKYGYTEQEILEELNDRLQEKISAFKEKVA